jgi:RNA polymerase sigma-70 factor (ECF subfamily)
MMTRQQFAEVYQGGGREKTRRFLLSLGADRDTARDVAQAAWVKGYERIAQLRDPRCLVPWINVIALNLFRDQVASRKSTRQLLLADEQIVSREFDSRVLAVRLALEKCNLFDRQLLDAFYWGGHSGEELAKQTGISVGAIHARLSRARQAVRDHMGESRCQVVTGEESLKMSAKREDIERSTETPAA